MEPIKAQKLMEERGLAVLLEPFLDDYFYPILPTPGWKVIFHRSNRSRLVHRALTESLILWI